MTVVEVERLLRMFAGELCELLWWRADEHQISFFVLVNDVFEWGTADAETIHTEDLDDLEQAMIECLQAGEPDDGPTLWVARKRGVRPQGAYYRHLGPPVHELFDAVGPEREVNILNPHSHP